MKKELPRILIISRSAWRNDNNTGATLSNLFSEWPSDRVANVYCRNEDPLNDICHKYYKITDEDVLRSILEKKEAGREYCWYENSIETRQISKNLKRERIIYGFFRNHRFIVLLALRELIWKLGKWKNRSLEMFLKGFCPDIIFFPVYDSFYMHDILYFCKGISKAKVILFFADDNCSLRQFSLSPLYWINRLLFRTKVRKSTTVSEKCYGITEELCEEYGRIFKEEFSLLYKGGEFLECRATKDIRNPLKLIYAGMLQYGRWKTLSEIARALSDINSSGKRAELLIYSQDRITEKIRRAVTIEGTSQFLGKISASEVNRKLQESDIVLHVESFNLKRKLLTRLSFSTKIVDLFHSARCIFAVGWKEAASIRYLVNNDAAIVATSKKAIKTKLQELFDNPSAILEYGRKAWDCGQRNHKDSEIKAQFYEDLISLKSKF